MSKPNKFEMISCLILTILFALGIMITAVAGFLMAIENQTRLERIEKRLERQNINLEV